MRAERYDYSVSFTRVMAMVFIVICHLGTYYEKTVIGQLFNVGVQIFFMISGYLYGDKEISKKGTWLFRRYLRLVVPALCWLLVYYAFAFAGREPFPQIHQIVFLVMNIQGLNFIFSAMQDLFIGPWFFTNIMACYILFLLFTTCKNKHPQIERFFDYGGVLPLLIFIVLGMLQISTDGALAFFIGVMLKRRAYFEKPQGRNGFISLAAIIIPVLFRLGFRHIADGTVIYNEVVAPLTHVILAGGIFTCIQWVFGMMPVLTKLCASKAMTFMDSISVYIYVVHHFFISLVFGQNIAMPIRVVEFTAVVLSLATILYHIGIFITKKTESFVQKAFL